MSDSFIAILGIGFLAGAIVTLIIIGAIKDERVDDIDLDMRLYVPHRDRDRCGDNRDMINKIGEKKNEEHNDSDT